MAHWSRDPKNAKKAARWRKRMSKAQRRSYSNRVTAPDTADDHTSRADKVVRRAIASGTRDVRGGESGPGRINVYDSTAEMALRHGEVEQLMNALGKAALNHVMEGK